MTAEHREFLELQVAMGRRVTFLAFLSCFPLAFGGRFAMLLWLSPLVPAVVALARAGLISPTGAQIRSQIRVCCSLMATRSAMLSLFYKWFMMCTVLNVVYLLVALSDGVDFLAIGRFVSFCLFGFGAVMCVGSLLILCGEESKEERK